MSVGDIFFWPVKTSLQATSMLFAIIILAFVIWMAIDCVNRKFKEAAEKWIWLVLILVTSWAGAILYYVFIKRLNPKGVAKK